MSMNLGPPIFYELELNIDLAKVWAIFSKLKMNLNLSFYSIYFRLTKSVLRDFVELDQQI